MLDLRTNLKTLEFKFPVFNVAGVWSANDHELENILMSDAGAAVFKSMSLEPREGNAKNRVFANEMLSVNSMGLPNKGVDYYCRIVEDLTYYKKPLVASIVGFAERDFYHLIEKVKDKPFDAIEVNLSCPNVSEGCIFAYQQKLSFKIMANLRKRTKKLLGVKLPPYNDRGDIEKMARGLVSAGCDFVTLINSVPLGCAIDLKTESMALRPNMGIGGLGGAVIKPITLSQIVLFRHFSKGKLKIIGVGGIKTGSDIYEFILAGATAVGVGTALWNEGPSIFTRLKKELKTVMRRKKVARLADKIGKLKIYS